MTPIGDKETSYKTHFEIIHTKNRKRFFYNSNHTIARQIDYLEQKDGVQHHLMDVPKIRDATIDHAFRRVQVFYYQSVVYFKENCSIYRDKTILQHGTSNYSWSSAAHSAILPNLTDNYFHNLKEQLFNYGLNTQSIRKLLTLGVSAAKLRSTQKNKPLNIQLIDQLLENIDTKHGLINGQCSFFHTMNATVELPHTVNQYDCLIETKMRNSALAILNKVSKNELHPHKASEVFVEKMQLFFAKSLKMTKKKIDLIKTIEITETKVCSFERKIKNETNNAKISKLFQD